MALDVDVRVVGDVEHDLRDRATGELELRPVLARHGVSYKALAEVEFTGDSQGVIFAQGSRFGGHALYVKDGSLTYAYNFLGIPPETRIAAAAPTSGRHVVGVEFTKERMGEHHESYGPLKLWVDDEVVAEQEIRTMTGHFTLCESPVNSASASAL